MRSLLPSRRARTLGFSLIEVLVGIAIGMIGMLVMYKTVTLWNARTRATVAGGDAQIAGTLGAYALERDLKSAGMGFTQATSDLGCTVQGNDATTGQAISFAFQPIEIVDGTATGVPDEIHVLYGSSSFTALRQIYQSSTGSSKTMTNTRNSFQPGDLAVVTDGIGGTPSGSHCALVEISSNTSPGGFILDHAAGSYTNYYAASAVAARYNNVSADVLAGTVFTAGNMYSLGPDPRRNVWSVVGDTLQVTDTLHPTNAAPPSYAEEIVDLKAYYGIDTAPFDKQISNAEWTKTPPATTAWSNLLAVRISLLVRSRNYVNPATTGDSDAQTYSAPNPVYTAAGGASAAFVMHDLGGTNDTNPAGPTNWRYYRYRVYERVVPLRNMLWCNSVPNC